MHDATYARSNYAPPEIEHRYGPNVHLLDDPVALGSIHWLLSFVRTHGFTSFGIYRIAVGLVFLIFVLGV